VALSALQRLLGGLGATRARLGASLSAEQGRLSPEALEEALLSADAGPDVAAELAAGLSRAVRKGEVGVGGELGWVKTRVAEMLNSTTAAAPEATPHVVLVVGVNGTGKTTTAAKLGHRWAREGRRTLLVAADTFRAAAVEQIVAWGERAGVEVVSRPPGSDPAAVVFDALQAAVRRSIERVVVDTAGRLHTRHNLMAELEKVRRVCGRAAPGAPHEVLLVLDATTGTNGLVQVRDFQRSAGVTGVVLTKLDGTAKGGVVLAIARDLGVPVRWVGLGEGLDDLLPFDAEAFAEALFEGLP
jgi:fused signal recognition particle receptor